MNEKNQHIPVATIPETFQKFKEYVSGLIKKYKHLHDKNKETKKELKEALEKQEKEKSFFKKLKEKVKDTLRDLGTPMPDTGGLKTSPEYQSRYTPPPQKEFGESLGEKSRFAEIYPPLKGYYVGSKASLFQPKTNTWLHEPGLSERDITCNAHPTHTYASKICSGISSIALPGGAVPDPKTLVRDGRTEPVFLKDENNCIYMHSEHNQHISFKFALSQIPNSIAPQESDKENMIFDALTPGTMQVLDQIRSQGSSLTHLQLLKNHIGQKKYPTDPLAVQSQLFKQSNAKNYLANLDRSPILECYSANTLFIGLCRNLGFQARRVRGYMVQDIEKDGKAYLGRHNGHAWSEVWDEKQNQRIKFDATPYLKEDGSPSGQNMEQSETGTGSNPAPGYPEKTPDEMLDEIAEKAREDSIVGRSEKVQKVIEKLEKGEDKKNIRKALDQSGLVDEAKDLIDKEGNQKILEQEIAEVQAAQDEQSVENLLKHSLLDEEYKKNLNDQVQKRIKQIQDDKIRMKQEMNKFGFQEGEMHLYKLYKELEQEIDQSGDVPKQANAIRAILPQEYHIKTIKQKDALTAYRSGAYIGNTNQIISAVLTGDSKIFNRSKEITKKSTEKKRFLNMVEVFAIDISPDMGSFIDRGQPLRESLKAVITRVKALEQFKVDAAIIMFDQRIGQVMNLGEKFNQANNFYFPAKLMRMVSKKGGGTNISGTLKLAFENIQKNINVYQQKTKQTSYGSISLFTNGLANFGSSGSALGSLTQALRNRGIQVTAYYIGTAANAHRSGSMSQYKEALETHFGSERSGGYVIVPDTAHLTQNLISNTTLHNILRKYSY